VGLDSTLSSGFLKSHRVRSLSPIFRLLLASLLLGWAGCFSPWDRPTNAVLRSVYHGSDDGTIPFPPDAEIATLGGFHPWQSTIERSCYLNGDLIRRWTWVVTDLPEQPEILVEQLNFEHDAVGHLTRLIRIDPATQSSRILFEADYKVVNQNPGGLLLAQTDESGIRTVFAYDSLKRATDITKKGVAVNDYPSQGDVTTSYVRNANDQVLQETVSSGGLSQSTVSTYDLVGRLTSLRTPDQLVTTTTYPEKGRKQVVANSAGETSIQKFFADRRLESITGTAVTNTYFSYDITAETMNYIYFPKNITTRRFGSANSSRWLSSVSDRRYVELKQVKPAFGATNLVISQSLRKEIGEVGRLETSMNGEPWKVDYEIDSFGNRIEERRWLEPGGQDETTVRRFSYGWGYRTNASGHVLKFEEKWSYPFDAAGQLEEKVRVEASEVRLTGFAANEISESIEYDAGGNATRTKVTVDRTQKKVTTTTTTSPASTLAAVQVALNGLAQTESSTTVSTPAWHCETGAVT
jgi:YD repeat-containing protein